MKILNLRLKNFIGIKKGLNLDEIDLDFSGLNGLIALAGPNGRGKTTILECCQPYARLVSRKGALQYHTFGRDAEKELSFEFQGDHYKTLVKIDSEGGRSEGFLWKNGISEIDGKISNYNKYITNLFGSAELFFNSVFCAQGSKKLSETTTGELKKLFSEFLRLDKLIAYEDTSKQCTNLLTSQASSVERDIESLKIVTDGYAEACDMLTKMRADKKALGLRLPELLEGIGSAEAELSMIQADIQKNEIAKTEISGLETTRSRLLSEIKEDQAQSKLELDELHAKYTTTHLEIVEIDSLLANETEIKDAATARDKLTAAIAKDRITLKDIDREYFAAIGAVAKKEADITECHLSHEKQINEIKKTKSKLKLQLKHSQLKLSDLDKRDPDCVSTTCSFIISALSAQQDIPGIETQLSECTENIVKTEKAYSNIRGRLDSDINNLKEAELASRAKREETDAKIIQLEDNLSKIEALANELPKVETASSKKADLEKLQTENIADGKKKKDFWEKRITDKRKQGELTATIIEQKKAKINSESEKNLSIVTQNIADLKKSITKQEDEIASSASDIILKEQEVVRKEQAQDEIADKKIKRERIVGEAADWSYLKNACSAKGLRALEIDSVCPVITNYANELLINTFGPNATISLRTQDDEGREILDIQILDENGDTVILGNRSGGEQVYALKAMRLAMAMVSKEKSGKNFQTILSDEETGPLDDDNAQKYISLYRTFMEQGGFNTCFYITHNANCVAMADHVLNFEHSRILVG